MKSSKLQAFIPTIFYYYCLPGSGDRDSTVLTQESIRDSYLIYLSFFLKLCCVYPERAEREEGSNIYDHRCTYVRRASYVCRAAEQRDQNSTTIFIFRRILLFISSSRMKMVLISIRHRLTDIVL